MAGGEAAAACSVIGLGGGGGGGGSTFKPQRTAEHNKKMVLKIVALSWKVHTLKKKNEHSKAVSGVYCAV